MKQLVRLVNTNFFMSVKGVSVACSQPQLLLTGKVESAQQQNNARNADTEKVAASV